MSLLAVNWGNVMVITGLGFGIVFVVLIILIFIMDLFGKVMAPKVSVKKTTSGKDSKEQTTEIEYDVHIPALDSAAIAAALHLYYDDVHDEESRVITIKKVEKRYSPWSSKIYGLNNNLTRR